MLVVAGVLIAGGSALFAQQLDDPPPPKPDRDALAELTQVIEYYAERDQTPEPPFSGEQNGFVFGSEARPDACPDGQLPQIFAESPDSNSLDFDTTYMPNGYTRTESADQRGETGPVLVGKCGGEVTLIVETWESSSGEISIRRQVTAPRISIGFFSADRLQETTIGTRPAVVVHPRFTGEEVWIFLRDDSSLWTIKSKAVGVEELVKVAEGLE